MRHKIVFLWILFGFALVQAQTITVVTPNGGETWAGASTQNISWTSSGVTQVDLAYTTNGGTSWIPITTNYPALSTPYPWLVPGAGPLGSTQCRVRVTSSTNNLITDMSNSNFTIPASGIQVLSPNGGELFQVGQMVSIRWSAVSIVNVDIDYSTNNGTNWTSIVTSVPASRSFFSWIIPSGITGDQLRIRVKDNSNATVQDVSDATFSIRGAMSPNARKYRGGSFDGYSRDNNLPKAITVTSPNGGETWSGSSMQNITWSSQNVDNVRIEFSSNNGSSWNIIQSTYPAGTGTFPWQVPSAGISGSNQCLVRISNATDLTLSDVSNGTWSIPASSISVLSPNGSEVFYNGSMRPIRWTSQSVVNVRIEYSTNGGSNWVLISDSIPAPRTFFSWQVPSGANTSQALVRVSDRLNSGTVLDVSNTVFQIQSNPSVTSRKFRGGSFDGYASDNSAPKSIQLITPNGGETWSGSSVQNIAWTSLNVSNVRLEYSTNNGTNWITIIGSFPASTGTYPWTVPGAGPTGSTQCRVRISDATDNTLLDVSDNTWTIPPSMVSLSTPSNGITYFTEASVSIRWSSQSVQNVRMEYSTDNGSSWILIHDSIPSIRTFYSWVVPNSAQSTQCKIKIFDRLDPSVTDQNSGVFTIRANPTSNSRKFRGGSYDGYATDIGCVQPVAALTGNQTICPGSTTNLTASIQFSPPWTLSWSDGTATFSQSGITSSPFIFQVTPSTHTTYSLTSLTGGCPGVATGSATVAIAPVPTATLSGTNTILLGQSAQLSFALTGTAPWSLGYTDGTSLTTVTGIMASPYTVSVSPVAHITYSPVSVSDNCTGTVSGVAAVTVNVLPNATISGSQTTCSGTGVQLSVALGGPGPWSLTWTDGVSNFTQSGITNPNYVFTVSPINTTTYTLVTVTNPLVGPVSGAAVVSVTPVMNVTLSGANTITQYQSTNLSFNLTGNSPWSFSYSDGTNTIPASGVTQNPYVVSVTPLETTTYSLVGMTSICPGNLLGNAVVLVNIPPMASLSGSQSVCLGSGAQLSVTVTGPGPWDITWTDGQTPVTVSGITQSPYLIQVTPSQSATYSLVSIVNPLIGSVSGTAQVTVVPVPAPVSNLLMSNTPACSSMDFSWTGSPGATSYQVDVSPFNNFSSFVSGWQNNSITGTSVNLTNLPPGTSYYIRVRSVNVCGASSNAGPVLGTTLPLPSAPVSSAAGSIRCNGFTTQWASVGNATDYELEVSLNSGFSSLLSGYNPLLTGNVTSQVVSGLSENTTYYWRVRGVNTCGVGSYSTSQTENTSLLASLVTSNTNTPVCSGGFVNLSATSTYPGITYFWSGPSGYSANGGMAILSNVNTGQSGVYSVVVSATGCAPVLRTETVQISNPLSGLSRGGNNVLCSGETLVLTTSVSGTAGSYLWQGPAGFTSAGATLTVNSITTASSGIYTVTVVSPGCNQVSDTIHVTVTNSITVSLSNNSPVCEGSVVFINSTSVPGSAYSWSGPGGFSSTAQNPSLVMTTPVMSGGYTLTLTQPGCTNPLSYITQVTVSPTLSGVGITSNSPVCTGNTLGFSATPIAGGNYQWSGPGGFTSGSTSFVRSNAQTSFTGQYSLTVTIPGCNAVTRLFYGEVYPTLVATAGSNTPVCQSGILLVSAPFYPNASYSWSGPSGFTSIQQNPSIVNAGIGQSGVYSLTVNQPVCGVSSTTVSVVVSPSPNLVQANTNSPVCQGGTLVVSAGTVSGLSYFWQGPGGFTSTAPSENIPNAGPPQAGVYTLTLSSNGCPSVVTVFPVVINNGLGGQAGALVNPLCAGSNLSLTSASVLNGLYSWSGPNGFTASNQNPAIPQVTSANSGVYTLLVTQPGCGTTSSTVSVYVGTPLNSQTLFNNSPVCTGGTLNMSTALTSGVSYLWSGPGGFTHSSNVVSISNVTMSDAGNYTLVMSSPGCNSRTFISKVIINNVGMLNASSNSPVCGGSVLQLSSVGVTGAAYSWSGPGGFVSSVQSPGISNSQPVNSGIYTLQMALPNCGVLTFTTTVQVGANLNTASATSNSPICNGNNLQLSGASITGASFSWMGPNGFTSDVQFPVINGVGFSAAGVYTLSMSTPGCLSVSRTHAVVVNPALASLPGSNSPVCQGAVVYFTSNTVPGATYSWTGPNGFTSLTAQPSLVNAQPVNSGEYTLTINAPGCSQVSGTATILVGNNLSSVVLSANSPVCQGNTLTLTSTSIGNGSISWAGPDGFTSDQSGFSHLNVQSNQSGIYSVVLSSPGCSSISRTIGVSVINPVLNPGSNSPVCQGNSIQLTTNAFSGATYTWTGPLGFVSSLRNPSISTASPTRTGFYTLTVNTPSCGAITSTTSVVVGSTLGSLSVSSNSPVCIAGSINLTATDRAGFTFNWTGPNGFTSSVAQPVVTPASALSAGRYTAVISSPGCGSTAVFSAPVNVNNPAMVSAAANTPVCVGNPIFFTGTAPVGSSYSWSGPSGFVSAVRNPSRSNAQVGFAGVYTMNATVPGCGLVSSTVAVVVNTCRTGSVSSDEVVEGSEVKEVAQESVFVLYPNPTEGMATVLLMGVPHQDYVLEVLDVLGHRVMVSGMKQSVGAEGYSWELNFGSLAKGMYWVKVYGDGFERVEKVVVR